MAKKSTYPAECPAFEYEGVAYEGRPVSGGGPYNIATCGEVRGEIYLVDEDGIYVASSRLRDVKPLTKTARQLLKWSTQS